MPKYPALPVLTTLAAASITLNGRRLRARAAQLAGVEPVHRGQVDTRGWRVVAAKGVEPHPRTLPAVVAWAEQQGLDAVDLVPGDLPVVRALDLLRQVDPATYRTDATVQGRTAGHALVVRTEVAGRAGLPTDRVAAAELVEVARQLKRYAPRTLDLAVAPCERAATWSPDEQLAVRRAVLDGNGSVNLTALAAQLSLLGVAAAAAPRTGAAALAAYQLQPALALGGRPGGLVPRDLGRQPATRWVGETRRWWGLLRADAEPPTSSRLADELRPYDEREIAS